MVTIKQSIKRINPLVLVQILVEILVQFQKIPIANIEFCHIGSRYFANLIYRYTTSTHIDIVKLWYIAIKIIRLLMIYITNTHT